MNIAQRAAEKIGLTLLFFAGLVLCLTSEEWRAAWKRIGQAINEITTKENA